MLRNGESRQQLGDCPGLVAQVGGGFCSGCRVLGVQVDEGCGRASEMSRLCSRHEEFRAIRSTTASSHAAMQS